jgi:hypothetical protein
MAQRADLAHRKEGVMPTIRLRNGRYRVMVRLKGYPPIYETMPEGTSYQEAREWGLEKERTYKVYNETPTLTKNVEKHFTLKDLIDFYRGKVGHARVSAHAQSLADVLDGKISNRPITLYDQFLETEAGLCGRPLDTIHTRTYLKIASEYGSAINVE